MPDDVYMRRLPLGGGPHPMLGRHVEHDPRSLRYAHGVMPRSALQPVQWTRRCAVLDQGQRSSCTGNAAAGWIGTDNAVRQGSRAVDEDLAVRLYERATELDEFDGTFPPDDSGSSGIAAAKALQQAGFCSGYTHAFLLPAVATALQSGPVMVGTAWYNSMFDPGSDGRIPVRASTGVAGGHEYLIDGFDPDPTAPDDVYWMTNSWGTSWGQQGRAWLTGADLATLLADDGDVTVPTPVTVPAPPPAPVDADRAFAAALRQYGWVTARHTGGNAYVAKQGRAWLEAKGL